MGTHERGARATADESDSRPQVGGDLEAVGVLARGVSAAPPCSSTIRRCPSEPERARLCWVFSMVAGSSAESRRSASAQASSEVSRLMTCRRMP
ncbi:hypothetical protein Y013_16245 [Rhodococcus pyridinivorans SB3094]|uniref:Uncharacterized protein n=1 Tax=Rhodococcus pyridinivorans SB3094 TaxID=1435356 RepID=V9XN51_9NOCA|nr:hypothetical protein Y013_16245 [Rhodococcus pyridinivorans SB3094]